MMNIKNFYKKEKQEQITVFYDNLNRIEQEFIRLSQMAEVLTGDTFDELIDGFALLRGFVNAKLRDK